MRLTKYLRVLIEQLSNFSNNSNNIDLRDGLQANELGAIARNIFGNRQ